MKGSVHQENIQPGASDYAWDPSYSGGRDQEDRSLKLAQGK
jgi:hypothetical protein